MTHQSFFRCLDKWISTVGSRVNSAFTNDAIFLRSKIYQTRSRRNLESDAVSGQWWAMVALPAVSWHAGPKLVTTAPSLRAAASCAAPRSPAPRKAFMAAAAAADFGGHLELSPGADWRRCRHGVWHNGLGDTGHVSTAQSPYCPYTAGI